MSAPATGSDLELDLRAPVRGDGARMHAFVRDSSLETNTRYAYLLLATHFAETSIVAEHDGEMMGFVAAYRVPARPDTLFVWQVGVSPKARRTGLAKRMLLALAGLLAPTGVCCIEATVGAGNEASARLFASTAKALSTECTWSTGFVADDFGDEDHEDEVLARVGPWEIQR